MAELTYPIRPSARLTRLALAGQTRMLVSVVAVILLLALAIDFAQHLRAVLERAAQPDTATGPVIARYMTYRAADILLRQMPIIAIITGFLAEFLRIRRGEATSIAAAGGTLAPALAAALVLGLVMGTAQAALETKLRPAAVWAQVELGLGDYARRFGPRDIAPRWFDSADGTVRAGVVIGPPGADPVLTDITVLPTPDSATGALVIEAARARPAPDQPGRWIAETVATWDAAPPHARTLRDTQVLDPGIDPVRMRYTDVPGFYLPVHDLRHLRATDPDADLETAQWRRILAVFVPGGFLIVGMALASVAVAVRGVRVIPLLVSLFAAYLATVALRVFWALAEMGAMAAWLGVAAPVAGVWLLGVALILRTSLRGPAR